VLRYFFTRQFAGFVLAGGLAALLHWIARILLSLVISFGWAVFVAYGVGMTTAFLLNSYFVFPASDKPVQKQARDFVIINMAFLPVVWVVSIGLNQLLVSAGVERFSEELAHGFAICLPVLATFLLYKFIAFRENYHG